MGACGSKPEAKYEAPKPQEASPAASERPPAPAEPAAGEQQNQSKEVEILPAGERATVAVLPPWVNNNSLSMSAGGGMLAGSTDGNGSCRNAAADAVRMHLSEIKAVLQQLPGVNQNPVIGLAEAAQLLRTHLNVPLVSIIGCTEGLTSYILLAAHGSGAQELEKNMVMKGADWSPYQVEGRNSHLVLNAENDEQAEVLPKDWQALYRTAGMRSFLAVSIGTAAETLGLLTIAKEEAHAFDDEWWELMLGVLAVGLLPQLRNDQISYLCHLVRVLDATTDRLSLIAMLLQGAHRLLLKTTNIKIGVRLGLLNAEVSKALIFEVDTATMGASVAAEVLTGVSREGLLGGINITEISLENTLLLDAVNKGKARFVSDCASYLQSCMKPATDIFISSQQMVASIVVLPLIYSGQHLGGLYFTLESPSNFQNIKGMLMGFVSSIVLLLHQKLEGQLAQMWEVLAQRSVVGDSSQDGKDLSGLGLNLATQHGSSSTAAAALAGAGPPPPAAAAAAANGGGGGGSGPGALAAATNGGAPTEQQQQGLLAGGVAGGGGQLLLPPGATLQQQQQQQQQAGGGGGGGVVGEVSASGMGKQVFVKRSCTEAMLKVLQHEIRKTHAKSSKLEWVDELVLLETLGKGGFGVVYKGTWKGSLAAIKVMYARQHERQAMKDALEMAVLTTVTHPNIIQVYSCFTDMVEDAGTHPALGVGAAAGAGGAAGGGLGGGAVGGEVGRINVRFRRLRPDENKNLATCNIVVMEYCDKGSLRHAMKRGVFHKRLGNTSVAVDLCAIVQVLLEVAHSVQHLHNIKLLHCDIKPENVLLKSDTTNTLGFVTKLSDFGLAKLLRENYYIVNRSGSGTVTHLAPELFQVGSKITTGVDTFSFGIMMWELYTGQRAYGGLGRDAIIDRVYKKQSRPVFPSGVPAMYSHLAQSCWETDVALRPNFATIIARLTEMLHAFQSGTYAGASAAAEAVRERLQQAAEQAMANAHHTVPPPAAAVGFPGDSLMAHPDAAVAAAAEGPPWGVPGGLPYSPGPPPVYGDPALAQQQQQQMLLQQLQQQHHMAAAGPYGSRQPPGVQGLPPGSGYGAPPPAAAAYTQPGLPVAGAAVAAAAFGAAGLAQGIQPALAANSAAAAGHAVDPRQLAVPHMQAGGGYVVDSGDSSPASGLMSEEAAWFEAEEQRRLAAMAAQQQDLQQQQLQG